MLTIRSSIHRSWLFLAAVLFCLVGFAVSGGASGGSSGGGSTETPTATPEASVSPEEKVAQLRRSAIEAYDKYFEETEKAALEMDEARLLKAAGGDSAEKAADKREKAIKRYRKSIGGFKKAVKLDPGFHEAWNMLGYSNRKLGQLGEAFQAYETCLKLNPDYDLAHEYLGEAWLQAGNIDKARAELAWLVEHKSSEASNLEKAIKRVVAGEAAFLGTEW
ncbi:MAG: tetratricopeptide repeat protein [Candidatus Eisenbacteria bacterium]|nr:tetratricopeptide repeat protein [Candidatus Eisenbacteria bacterium]